MLLLLLAQLAAEPQPVTVVLRDRFGRAVTDARVCAPNGDACAPLALKDGTTSAPPGALLRLEAPAFEVVEVKAAARVEATLRAKGSISARALSPDEKRPLDATFALAAVSGPRTFSERALVEKRVELPPRPKSTEVKLEGIPPGTYVLSWGGPDLAHGERVVTVHKDESRAVGTLSVERGVAVSGAVRDETGVALAGVTVSLSQEAVFDESAGLVHRATTAADGSFQFRGVAPGETRRILARLPGYLTERGTWGGETRLEIVLPRAQRITAVVKDPEGEPLPGAAASLSYTSKAGYVPADSAEADVDGKLVLTRTARLKGTLVVRRDGFRAVFRNVDAQGEQAAKDVDLGELRLARGRVLGGQVTRKSTGAPLADAQVMAERTTPVSLAGQLTTEAAAATTNASGQFELAGLPDDAPLTIQAVKDGFAPQTKTTEPGLDTYDFVLSAGGRVEGTVCGPPWETGASVIWFGGSARNQAAVDSSGRFVLEHRAPGPLQISRAWVIRNPFEPAQVSQMSGLTFTVTVEEDKTATVRIGCDGIPVSGVVTLDGRPLAAHRGLALVGEDGADDEDFLTNDAGRFSFRARKPGLYRFDFHGFLSQGFYTTPEGGGCQVPAGGTDSCLIALTTLPRKAP